MPPASASDLVGELQNYGVPPDKVRLFTGPAGPEHQEYLNLLSPAATSSDQHDGVAEAQNRPVLYFVDNTRLIKSQEPPEQAAGRIRGKLACRGERAYLARVETGRIHVAPIAFEDVAVDWM